MCQLLTATEPLKECRRHLADPTASITCTPGVDGQHFDTDHSVFRVPYATIFTLSVSVNNEHAWSGVFAFDLLRQTKGKWSPGQEASRVVVSILSPHGEIAKFKQGCCLMESILPIVSNKAAAFMERWQWVCRQPQNTIHQVEINELWNTWSALANDPTFQTKRSEFREISLSTLITLHPSEFRVYSTFTLSHEKHDYSKCTYAFRARIVSAPHAQHRYLVELRPQFTGLQIPDDEELARWLCTYVQKKNNTVTDKTQRLPANWRAKIWMELTQKTESEHQLDAWAETDPAQVPLSILIGSEKASGMRIPSIETTYAGIREITVTADTVRFKTSKTSLNETSVPTDVELRCVTSHTAQALADALKRRERRRIGRSKEIRAIAAFYGEPWNSITLTGYSSQEVDCLVHDFTQAHSDKRISVDTVGARVHISAN